MEDLQIFQKSRRNLKILGNRKMTRSKFCTEDPQVHLTPPSKM